MEVINRWWKPFQGCRIQEERHSGSIQEGSKVDHSGRIGMVRKKEERMHSGSKGGGGRATVVAKSEGKGMKTWEDHSDFKKGEKRLRGSKVRELCNIINSRALVYLSSNYLLKLRRGNCWSNLETENKIKNKKNFLGFKFEF